MALALIEDLTEKDQKHLKRLITSEPTSLSEEEVRDIFARRAYLSSNILSLFKNRFNELDLSVLDKK